MKRGKSIKNKPIEPRITTRCFKIRHTNIGKMTKAEQRVKEIFESKRVKYIPQYPIYTRTSMV